MLAQLDLNSIQQSALPGNHIPGSLGDLITAILPYVFYGAGIALLIYMIFGGFQLMLSKGDPKTMQAAQAKITNAIIGFLIVVGSAIIVRLLGQLLGLTIFGSIIK